MSALDILLEVGTIIGLAATITGLVIALARVIDPWVQRRSRSRWG